MVVFAGATGAAPSQHEVAASDVHGPASDASPHGGHVAASAASAGAATNASASASAAIRSFIDMERYQAFRGASNPR